MNTEKQDDLNKLLNTFMAPDSAEKAVEDFRQVDLFFEQYNKEAEPDSELLSKIKADISRELGHDKSSVFKTAMLRFVAAAAVFLVAASVWFVVDQDSPQQQSPSPATAQVTDVDSAESIWDSEDITANDIQYAIFERELQQIELEIAAIRNETYFTIQGEFDLTELENDFIEIESDFWKG